MFSPQYPWHDDITFGCCFQVRDSTSGFTIGATVTSFKGRIFPCRAGGNKWARVCQSWGSPILNGSLGAYIDWRLSPQSPTVNRGTVNYIWITLFNGRFWKWSTSVVLFLFCFVPFSFLASSLFLAHPSHKSKCRWKYNFVGTMQCLKPFVWKLRCPKFCQHALIAVLIMTIVKVQLSYEDYCGAVSD